MKIDDNGRKFIEGWEGCILQAYDDYNDKVVSPGSHAKGTLTIGFGHTTAAGLPAVYVGQTITRGEADQLLASDLAAVESQLNTLLKVQVNQNQYNALGSFEFNTGALAHSSALKYLNDGDYSSACYIMAEYIHASGKVVDGLVRRRAAEIALFKTAPKLSTPMAPRLTFWQQLLSTLFGVKF